MRCTNVQPEAVSLVLSVAFLWAAVVGAVIDVLLLLAVWLVPDRIGLQRRRGG